MNDCDWLVDHPWIWWSFVRVQANGGAVVSIPFASPLRFEVGDGSDLPKRLAQHGCSAIYRNQETRVTSDGFVMRNVYEIFLPR